LWFYLRCFSRKTLGGISKPDPTLERDASDNELYWHGALTMETFVAAKKCQNILVMTYDKESMPKR
jgi:hypothetical protein